MLKGKIGYLIFLINLPKNLINNRYMKSWPGIGVVNVKIYLLLEDSISMIELVR